MLKPKTKGWSSRCLFLAVFDIHQCLYTSVCAMTSITWAPQRSPIQNWVFFLKYNVTETETQYTSSSIKTKGIDTTCFFTHWLSYDEINQWKQEEIHIFNSQSEDIANPWPYTVLESVYGQKCDQFSVIHMEPFSLYSLPMKESQLLQSEGEVNAGKLTKRPAGLFQLK
jgi:hypothetical protein